MIEFILFIGIVVLLFWISSVSNRLKDLEKKISRQSAVSVGPLPSAMPQAAPAASRSDLLQRHQTDVLPEPMAIPQPPMTLEPEPAKEETKPEGDMEATFATNWLNKIGVVALLFGMVYFFIYAVGQGWIGPWLRVTIGFLVSGLLIYLGSLWKSKYGDRAHALSGGGIALLYFTIFAAYQFYNLMPEAAAFVLILLTAGLSVWLSFTYSSITLGFLGFFGAYGAPIMLNSGQDQQAMLFVYLTILNLTVLFILAKKFWMELLLLALLGTAIDFVWWANMFSGSNNTFASLFFVIVSTVLLVLGLAGMIKYHKTKAELPPQTNRDGAIIAFLAGIFYFVSIFGLLDTNYHSMLAPAALMGGVLYFFAYSLIDRLELRSINYCYSLVGAVLLVSAAGWEWHGKALAFAWLALGLLGISLGALLKREEIRIWSIMILFLALCKTVIEPYTPADQVFLFNAKFGLMLANSLALLYAGWLYDKVQPSQNEQHAQTVFEIIAAVLFWVAITWDISAAVIGMPGLWYDQWITFWWVLFPILLAFIAFASERKFLLGLSVVLIFLGLFRVLLLPYDNAPVFLLNAKFGLMLAEGLGLLFIAGLYNKQEGKNQLSDLLKVGASLLLWVAVSWDIIEYFRYDISANSRNLSLSLWWVVYAVILLVAGGISRIAVYRKVAIFLFSLVILKVFLYDVQTLDTPYRIISFIVLGVILLSVSFTYQKNKEKIKEFLKE